MRVRASRFRPRSARYRASAPRRFAPKTFQSGTNYFHANSPAADLLAVGSQSIAVGIGDGAVVDATAPGGVAIGQQSHSAAGEVDIGNRQITGVAAGKAGTDAVNVSQLAAVTTQLTTLINNQSRGGGGAPFSSTPGSSPASTGPNSSAGGQGSVASDSNSTVYR
ncbi:hypothetical protein C9419_29235 [Paraburkholderia fungorum]|nr:hypothetical protein C9419_29235 [Paraburkholderia fungorum]